VPCIVFYDPWILLSSLKITALSSLDSKSEVSMNALPGCSLSPVAGVLVWRCRTGVRQLLEEKMHELVLFINSLMRDSTINPFSYLSSSNARILSGEEEGAFQWISVNYLLGSFAGESTTVYRGLLCGPDGAFDRLCLSVCQSVCPGDNFRIK